MTNPTKPQQTKATCPQCGGHEFAVPYTESAYEYVTASDASGGTALDFIEDGQDVYERESDLSAAECRNWKCRAKVDLTGYEVV